MIGKHKANETSVNYGRLIRDCGTVNTQRYIDITALQSELEMKTPGLSRAMIGLHAFIDSDFTAVFPKKGKVTPLQLLIKDEEHKYIDAFIALSKNPISDMSTIQEFV